jgi:mannose-6-phosphate isomerase
MPRRIIGVVKNYDWGDTTSIATALGMAPSSAPIAEYWWGTHPQGSSRVDTTGEVNLSDEIGSLKVLVKLLACNQPLSLQTHPTVNQAVTGFAKEDSMGIPRDSASRMYRDESDKPEMLIALTPFEALCGFTDVDSAVERLRTMNWHDEADILEQNGMHGYLSWAFEQHDTPSMSDAPTWLQNIATQHPTDCGLRVAPLLHHVTLKPGEAICLPAGNLHAYLHGFGLEVMSSSDNIIRAGFTTKHVDIAELLRIVDVTPLAHPVVSPSHVDGHDVYPSPSPAFSVSRATSGSLTLSASNNHRIVVIINTGSTEAFVVATGETASFTSDGSIWIITQN